MLNNDADYFLELQTQTGWGRTLYSFATWCAPNEDWRVLDVGCGPGLLPAIFTQFGCRAVGIDLDIGMFHPSALHPEIAVANVYDLPFTTHTFDLITASNLIFLLSEPSGALVGMKLFLKPGGRVAMLNPSEVLTKKAASDFANEKGLEGVARNTLLNWARRASDHHQYNEAETNTLYREAGMKCMASILKVGPGFGRFSWGVVESYD